MTSSPAVNATIIDNLKQQAIFRDKHDKNFTIIGNETLDIHIPGDPITAYEIHKVLLKLPPTFKPTIKWICKRFGESKDVIGPKMTRLANVGLAKHVREIDPVTKKITGHYWCVYESRQEPQRENDGCGSSDENPHETSENNPKSHDRKNDVVVPYIDHRNNNSSIKNILTTTPEPIPKPKPKSPPAPQIEIAVVAEIKNIKKIIEPEISLNRNAIEKLIGIDYDHIRYAKNEAMKPGTKNTNGLFIYLCNEEMSPMEKLKNGLDTVVVPSDIDGDSVEMRKITCYNRNVSNLTCTSILGTAPVNKECLQLCPFYVQRMEQDLKLYQKICVEIVHETDKAFLVHPVDSLNEHWIPKSVIKKQEYYGDDSFLLTIPKSFELKNVGYCGQNGTIK